MNTLNTDDIYTNAIDTSNTMTTMNTNTINAPNTNANTRPSL